MEDIEEIRSLSDSSSNSYNDVEMLEEPPSKKVCGESSVNHPRETESQIEVIDQKVAQEKLVRGMIKHDIPFSLVEYEGIREWSTYLNPDFRHISRNTATTDMLKIYEKEKIKIKDMLANVSGKICLTTDAWISSMGDEYVTLTAHFVDDNWAIQSKIIQYAIVLSPHTEYNLYEKVWAFLNQWGIEKKIFSITLDNATSNDSLQDHLLRRMNDDNLLLCHGKHFHVRCCGYILNFIVQEGLKIVDSEKTKIHESIKYVKESRARKSAFKKCVEEMKIETQMRLRLDVSTRWNFTFAMLESALLYRKAFGQLRLVDQSYKCFLSEEEWNSVERMCNFLKPFDEITTLFSGREYVTSNIYFLYLWRIHYKLIEAANSRDGRFQEMAIKMQEKFDTYWDNYTFVLAFALILDPRYKLNFIVYCYDKLDQSPLMENSKAKITRVKTELYELYEEYKKLIPSEERRNVNENTSNVSVSIVYPDDEFDAFDLNQMHNMKSELDIYLDDPRYSRVKYPDLDVLNYWKTQKDRFPILSMMARDIMSIPITTVASGSAFSIGSRVLNKYRSNINPSNVEALICLRNWFNGYADVQNEEQNPVIQLSDV